MTLRWVFPDPNEAPARADVDRRIDAWWASLAQVRPRLVPQVDRSFDLVGHVATHLLGIHPELRWELRPGARERWCFVVTAEEGRHLEPLVGRIVERAPAGLGFEVASARGPEPVEAALATVEGRFGVDASAWTVEFGEPQHGFMNVCWRGAADPEAAVWLMKCLVGERAVMDWVGPVDVARPSLRAKLFRGSQPGVGGFVGAFEAQQRALLERRPSKPLQQRAAEASWSVVSFNPDAPREGRLRDLLTAATPDLELLQVVVSGAPFSSQRFSRFGEAFLYVQVEVSPDEGAALRMRLEEAIDTGLAGAGRVVTSGTGARCSYVVVVVTELLEGVARLRALLEARQVPRNTWIRFLDDALAAEWVGVFGDTPRPPDER
jgi:hypothetical protein